MNIIGEVKLWAGEFEPPGWTFCDGKNLDCADFVDLYSVIGSSFNDLGPRGPQAGQFGISRIDPYFSTNDSPIRYIICYEGYLGLEQRIKNFKNKESSPDDVANVVAKLDLTYVEKNVPSKYKNRS